jgi:predicted PurR-regulated permease PerM
MRIPEPSADSVLTPDVDVAATAAPAVPGGPKPDLVRTKQAVESGAGRSVGVTILAVLALLYTLYFARDFILPITIAVLLDFLFSPVVRVLTRLHVPTPLGAGIVVLGVIGLLVLGAYNLSDPVQGWVAKAPETLSTARTRVARILRPVEQVSKTAEQVVANASAGGAGAPRTQEVVVKGPSVVSRVFGTTQRLLGHVLEVLVLLYFLLAAGDLFLQKLIKVLPNLHDKKTAVQIARETEASISTYLLSALLMNIGEGIVVGIALYLLGMPNPVLWGVLVVILEFVPYLGALTMVAILTVAALTSFDNVGHALLAPAAFLVINLIQANFVYPLLMSRRLTLNPVAIFVGLAFWWWIWGIAGAFIAVPLIATFKIFCDHIEALAPIGEFLGERDEAERRRTVRAES